MIKTNINCTRACTAVDYILQGHPVAPVVIFWMPGTECEATKWFGCKWSNFEFELNNLMPWSF